MSKESFDLDLNKKDQENNEKTKKMVQVKKKNATIFMNDIHSYMCSMSRIK